MPGGPSGGKKPGWDGAALLGGACPAEFPHLTSRPVRGHFCCLWSFVTTATRNSYTPGDLHELLKQVHRRGKQGLGGSGGMEE